MGTKMKGLIKGFRYISQIFEEDKEPEMQIGLPTDVKHVAHIGWDGPSVNSPSWMTNFKSDLDFTSSGLTLPEDATRGLPPIKPPSEDSSSQSRRVSESAATRNLPDLPKASRRHASSNGTIDCTVRDKSEKRHSRRPHSGDESKESSGAQTSVDLSDASPANSLPDIPKKSIRRKKNKDLSAGGSTRSSSRSSSKARAASASCGYASPFSDPGTGVLPGSRLMDDSFSSSPSPNLQPFGRLEDKMKT
uniref:CRIB domain-containing protein n=1 Tax=Kalanchoe fedtschenkoi TaxID=63787 RepID=A0A7N0ZWJ5_KALFE